MVWFLLALQAVFLGVFLWFFQESRREGEPRAPWVGLGGAISMAVLMALTALLPEVRWPLLLVLVLLLAGVAALIAFGRPVTRALAGAGALVEGEFTPADERDIVFARNRSIREGSDQYQEYYQAHPELEERDAARRKRGGPVGRPGSIDGGHRPTVAMAMANFMMPGYLGPHAEPAPDQANPPAELDPEAAARRIKGYARHIGAALVGICRTDPRWAYSRRGEIFYENWEDWGRELPPPLPYTIVVATAMDWDLVAAGPHTPTVVESSANYAAGAFITSALARMIANLGHRAVAHHSRHYDLVLVPLAIDAGLGEMGRHGYLIAPRLGPRVRLFAVTTDLPLAVDQPIDLGVDDFCRVCRKCADTCPSHSIPKGDKVLHHGVRKWKLDAEGCFDYWGKAGTDCSVCMGICPFSRPDRPLHRTVRWALERSGPARRILPHLDNWVYGRKWKPRKPPEWVDWRD